MPNDPIQIRTDPPRPAQARRRKPRHRWLLPLASAVFFTIAVAAIVFNMNSSAGNRASPPSGPANRASTQSQPRAEDRNPQSPAAAPREQIVEDPAGELLWASPTAGPPISLAYVPAGTQCLIHLRPASIASHPEGERIIAALGPWGQEAQARLTAAARSGLRVSERMLIAIVVRADGQLDAAIRVESSQLKTHEEFMDQFVDEHELKEHDGQRYVVMRGRGYFLAPASYSTAEPTRQLRLSAPAELIPELIDSADQPPPLVRDIETLAAYADGDRAVTVILAPKFLQASGNELLVDQAAPLHDAFEWLLGADATVIALSAHWDDNFFVELRAAPALNVPPRRLAAQLRARIASAPDAVEEIVLASPWHPHGRKVLARLPGMLRALARYSRSGEERRQALVRCYLPPMAGHNLLMAGELLLTQPHAGEVAAATGFREPRTLKERLAAKTSLTFTKDSLERALEMLAEDIGVEITIQGADLQLEGITKNQSLALDLRERPAAEILVEILRRANPDRTATNPADPRQKLVYIIEPAAGGDPGRIIVTTRTAAEKRGDQLPVPFASKAP